MELNFHLCPMIVFHGVKREKKGLGEKFKNRCVVSSSTKALINERTHVALGATSLGSFLIPTTFISVDSFDCHRVSGVKEALKRINIDQVIIPGG